jgi:hypothetical protein
MLAYGCRLLVLAIFPRIRLGLRLLLYNLGILLSLERVLV